MKNIIHVLTVAYRRWRGLKPVTHTSSTGTLWSVFPDDTAHMRTNYGEFWVKVDYKTFAQAAKAGIWPH